MVTEVGLSHDVGYHPDEKRRVAIHEAGHALLATLVGRDVKLASILRRSGSLGLVAHGDVEERYLRTPSEAHDLMAIAMAGRAAEIQEFGELFERHRQRPAGGNHHRRPTGGHAGRQRQLLSRKLRTWPAPATWWPRCCTTTGREEGRPTDELRR